MIRKLPFKQTGRFFPEKTGRFEVIFLQDEMASNKRRFSFEKKTKMENKNRPVCRGSLSGSFGV